MLVVPADAALDQVSAWISAGDVAALVLNLGDAPAPDAARLGALAAAGQARGVAVLLDGPVPIAEAAGMDGVHVADPARLPAILKALKSNGQSGPLVGVGGLSGRHAAMEAGEAGADYLMFGARDGADFATACDLVSWWADLFEVPCVGLATTPEAVAAFAAAGADFVALAPGLLGQDGAVAQAQRLITPAPAAMDIPG